MILPSLVCLAKLEEPVILKNSGKLSARANHSTLRFQRTALPSKPSTVTWILIENGMVISSRTMTSSIINSSRRVHVR